MANVGSLVAIDTATLAQLYEQHRRTWVTFALRSGARERAEDVVQDVMLICLEGLEPPVGLEPLDFVRDLIRLLSNRYRQSTLRFGLFREKIRHWETLRRFTPKEMDFRTTVQHAVWQTAHDLNEEDTLVWRALVMGETTRELAVRLNVSQSTATRRLVACIKALRVTLAPYSQDLKPRLRRLADQGPS